MIIHSSRFINYDTSGNYMCSKVLVGVISLLNAALWLYNEVRGPEKLKAHDLHAQLRGFSLNHCLAQRMGCFWNTRIITNPELTDLNRFKTFYVASFHCSKGQPREEEPKKIRQGRKGVKSQ